MSGTPCAPPPTPLLCPTHCACRVHTDPCLGAIASTVPAECPVFSTQIFTWSSGPQLNFHLPKAFPDCPVGANLVASSCLHEHYYPRHPASDLELRDEDGWVAESEGCQEAPLAGLCNSLRGERAQWGSASESLAACHVKKTDGNDTFPPLLPALLFCSLYRE